jgi:predicted metal-dependent HD superfamily phosphohydrolase
MKARQEAEEFILGKLRKELPEHLTYHSVSHVLDVYESCKFIAQSEGISGDDLELLLLAALFHDSGFVVQAKDHEEISCGIAREHLPRFGYSEEQLEKICGMIMATKIPQTPHNKLEEIIADADLDYLGRDDFYVIGQTLFTELTHMGVLSTEEEWNRMQVRFLENHHYFTETAVKWRKNKKEKHMQEIRSKI